MRTLSNDSGQIKLRELIATHKELARKLAEQEQKVGTLVCTPTRGVLSGMPILVGQDELTWAEDFEH